VGKLYLFTAEQCTSFLWGGGGGGGGEKKKKGKKNQNVEINKTYFLRTLIGGHGQF
jgi:hypothetical protein